MFSSTPNRRLMMELQDFRQNPIQNISAQPIDEDKDLFNWIGSIIGPEGTPYSGGVFYLQITFSIDYPYKPPNIVFITQIYHPNINYKNGDISLDTLNDNWNPALTLQKIYQEDKQQFVKTATEWTKKYAS